MPRVYVNSHKLFCCVCDEFTRRTEKSQFLLFEKSFEDQFDIPIKNQEKPWVHEVCCSKYFKYLTSWYKGTIKDKPFSVPMQ